MKKRMLALCLTLALSLALAVPALAAKTTEPPTWTLTEIVPYGQLTALGRLSDNLFLVEKNGKTGCISITGKEVVPYKYETETLGIHINDAEGFVKVTLDGKYGFLDQTGQEAIPCKYDSANDFCNGFAAVQMNGKWGFVDTAGREVIPCKYEEVGDFSEGLAAVKLDGKWGFINKTAQEVISCKYEDVGDFSEDLAAVKLDGKWGFIDKTGQEAVSCKYDRVENFSESLAVVAIDTGEPGVYLETLYKYGFIDVTGKEVVPCKYAHAYSILGGLAAVAMDGEEGSAANPLHNWGYIDKTGKEVVPCGYYDSVLTQQSLVWYWAPQIDGLFQVERDGKVGMVDVTGTEVIPCKYEELSDYSENLLKVKLDGKWGVIDTTGKEVIPCKYEDAIFFSKDLFIVCLNEKYGMINATGKEVIACKYEDADRFFDGLVSVKLNGKYGVIDTTGKEVIPLQYDWMGCIDGEEDWAPAKKDGVLSYIDKTGKEIFSLEGEYLLGSPDYEWLDDEAHFSGGLAFIVKQDPQPNHWEYLTGLIDRNGQEVFPPIYHTVAAYYTYDYDETSQNYSYGPHYLVEAGVDVLDMYGLYALTRNTADPVVDEMSLSGSSVSVKVGKTASVTATVSGYEGKSLYAISGDASVATVSVSGKTVTVEGVAKGSTSIYVIMSDSTEATLDQAKADPSMREIRVTVTKASGGNAGGGSSSGGSTGGDSTTASDTTKPASEVFTDVTKGSWYEDGVTFVVNKGLFQGMGNGTFAPQQNMTRAMLMTVLARLDGQDTNGGATWYEKGMAWAKAQGVSDGTMPEGNVTREQLVTMLYRYAKSPSAKGSLTTFSDGANASDWARSAMAWAVSQGILTGKDGQRLDPQGTATRAEVATILQRFVEKTGK